jgi:hypothetical protein
MRPVFKYPEGLCFLGPAGSRVNQMQSGPKLTLPPGHRYKLLTVPQDKDSLATIGLLRT